MSINITITQAARRPLHLPITWTTPFVLLLIYYIYLLSSLLAIGALSILGPKVSLNPRVCMFDKDG